MFPGRYFTGDGARKDPEGNFWIMGRVDDVLNVSGHRLSTMEIESAWSVIRALPRPPSSASPTTSRGRPLPPSSPWSRASRPATTCKKALAAHVVKEIGALARPDTIRFTEALPKTRSGKIMRRLLRDVAAGVESTGDTTTLEDLSVMASLRQEEE